MKKIIYTLSIALFSSVLVFAQNDILLEDFEDDKIDFTTTVNINPEGSMEANIVDNPVKDGINTSNKVWEWKRVAGVTGPVIYAGFWAPLSQEIPAGYERIEVKYMRTNANSQLKLKVEGSVNVEIMPLTAASKVNEWENMVFDLAANGVQNIKVLSLFPDYYEPINSSSISFVDDIKVFVGDGVTPPPPADSLVIFHDSEDPRFYDQSVVTQTAPSTVVTEAFEPGAANGDKLPVVTTPVAGGTNALKLQWFSKEGGTWTAFVASIGWQSFDVTSFAHLKFWINSSTALAVTDLPQVYLESTAGTPKFTGKVKLSDYLTTDLTADTWTEVMIPLADIWDADATFTSKTDIKGVYFTQNEVGMMEYTLFLDEFSFHKTATAIDNPFAKNQLKAYFTNGEIRFAEYSGHVQIYDLIGRKVAEGDTFNKTFKVNLQNGIYILSTSDGSTKLSVQ